MATGGLKSDSGGEAGAMGSGPEAETQALLKYVGCGRLTKVDVERIVIGSQRHHRNPSWAAITQPRLLGPEVGALAETQGAHPGSLPFDSVSLP